MVIIKNIFNIFWKLILACITLFATFSIVLIIISHVSKEISIPTINSVKDYTILLHNIGTHTNIPVISNLLAKFEGMEKYVPKEKIDEEQNAYYALLSDEQKLVYSQIYENAKRKNTSFFLPNDTLGYQEIYDCWESALLDHPEIFWLEDECYISNIKGGKPFSMRLRFNELANNIEKHTTELELAAEKIIDKTERANTALGKVQFVHDLITKDIEYDKNSNVNQTAYSALVNKKTICSGYAKSFQYIMHKLDIPCYYVMGYCGEDNHAWNIVKIDDEYYNIDPTLDDVLDTHAFYMRTDDDIGGSHVRRELSTKLVACEGEKFRNSELVPLILFED